MHKDKALAHIKKDLASEEELIGFFQAQGAFRLWLFFIIGPLAVLSLRQYFVAVTNKGIHFHLLNILGKFSQHDFFSYDEIKKIEIGKGMLQIPIKFFFENKKLKIKAQKKGFERVATVDEKTLDYIKNNVKSV